jgi:hypothetical protein
VAIPLPQYFPCAVDKEEALSIVCLINADSTMTNTRHLLDISPMPLPNSSYYFFYLSVNTLFIYPACSSLLTGLLNWTYEVINWYSSRRLSQNVLCTKGLHNRPLTRDIPRKCKERPTFWYEIFFFITLFTYALQNFFTDAEREYTIQTQYNPVHLPTGFLSTVPT